MGLFDYITFDVPIYTQALPDVNFNQLEFQTKDLNCLLDRYRVATDGQLMIKRTGRFRPVVPDDFEIDYDNITIVFYEYFSKKGEMIAFDCEFVDGVLSTEINFNTPYSSDNVQWLNEPFDWSKVP